MVAGGAPTGLSDANVAVSHRAFDLGSPGCAFRLKIYVQAIGADYLVLPDAWNATHTRPPELMGQLFHLFEAPNRFGLPAFYTLHVWAWKDSPTGTFVNWHANVSCDAFSGQNP